MDSQANPADLVSGLRRHKQILPNQWEPQFLRWTGSNTIRRMGGEQSPKHNHKPPA